MALVQVKPLTPGELLEKEFLRPSGISRAQLANRLAVPSNRVTQIIKGQRSITPNTALRLEALFGWPAGEWMKIQAEYDLALERENHGAQIGRKVTRLDHPPPYSKR